jgi:DNA replication and repair protein RecF
VRLRRLGLSNFRNYSELDLRPSAGLNVFIGDNAQGKSNLLEGIAMLGTGKSFRTARDGDTIRAGDESAVVHGAADSLAGSLNLVCTIERWNRGARKRYTVNAHGVRYSSYLGKIRIVTFVPADLQLATGTPATRRAFMNASLAQSEPRYYYELARYRKALAQKNALLRGEVEPDPELLAIYNRSLIDAGARIMLARAQFVDAIAKSAAEAHTRFTHGEHLEVCYAPSVAFRDLALDAIETTLEARVRQVSDAERARMSALVGPHRDDLSLSLDGVSLAAFGSQGQQRTAVLALKVAEYSVMLQRSGEAPLLLLDDVLSELDEDRATAFLDEIGTYDQSFVTATHLPAGLPPSTDVARIRNATVHAWAGC